MSEKFSGADPNRVQNGWGDFDSMIEVLENGGENMAQPPDTDRLFPPGTMPTSL